MTRILLIAFLLLNISAMAQDTDTLCIIFSKQKQDGTSKNFIVEQSDFVKVNLKDDTKVKGRISNISENGFKVDTVNVQFDNVVRLGMNSKKRRHIGQYISAWVLGIGATAAITGFVFIAWSDSDTAVGLWAIGAVSGITSSYTLDLAYGKKKKFHLTEGKWKVNVVLRNQ